MDRIHRKELKHDKFIEQVGHGVEYAVDHRRQFAKWAIVGAGVLLVAIGISLFLRRQADVRADELRAAMRAMDAAVGPAPNEFVASYPTQAEKEAAVVKAFTNVASQYPNQREGVVAAYFLGTIAADQGKFAESEKRLRQVAGSGKEPYASQAKLSLADLLESQGKIADAEKLARALVANPSILVSKEQATIKLARLISKSKPQEARKLLEPLRTERSAVSRVALTALSEIPVR